MPDIRTVSAHANAVAGEAERPNRVALVTGAGSGMGLATAVRLASAGWGVVAGDIRGAGQSELPASARARIRQVTLDVSSPEAQHETMEYVESEFGRLDGLVLNAGISTATPIETLTPSMLQRQLDVNLFGPVLGIQTALPLLKQSPNGSIVVVASTNGLGGDNSMSAYAASKFAVVGLVKSLSREIARYGIRVNAVCPGATRTGMTEPLRQSDPERYDLIAAQVPLGRWAEPDEIAAVIEFLLSQGASYVNGAAIPVDGGASAGVGLHPPAHEQSDVRTFDYR